MKYCLIIMVNIFVCITCAHAQQTGYTQKTIMDTLAGKTPRYSWQPKKSRIIYGYNCPVCHKFDKVVPLVHGYVTPELAQREIKGEIKIGDCVMDPTKSYYCRRDYHSF